MARKKVPKPAAPKDGNGAGQGLLGLLDSIGEADLKAIEAKIDGINAQIEALVKERKGLDQIRRMVDVKLHGVPAKKTRTTASEQVATIAEYLGNGPATVREIAVATQIPIPSVRKRLKGGQFAEEEDGRWGLALERPASGTYSGPLSGRSPAPHA